MQTYMVHSVFCILCGLILFGCQPKGASRNGSPDSLEGFRTFFSKYPDSTLSDIDIARYEELLFDSVAQVNSVAAYRRFLKEFPNGPLAIKARKGILDAGGMIVHVGSFRGNASRNFYGDSAPSSLGEIWKVSLGSGKSFAYGKMYVWTGAGWTGQPLMVEDKTGKYLIQGAFDYHLRKIKAETGEVVWKYKFDDILKGSPTIGPNPVAKSPETEYVIMQGSRRGEVGGQAGMAPSFRGISYASGLELWRLNSRKTASYSRDVDGSALVVGDTTYIGLENGLFTVFSLAPELAAERDGMLQPLIYHEEMLYENSDMASHGANLVTESSPALLNGKIYITSGSGHVYGYNIATGKIDWDFYIGADMDGTPPVTDDSCILVTVEKEYIRGKGGVYKLDPSKSPDESVVWFMPTEDKPYFTWSGGIIGSAAVNDAYVENHEPHLAVFSGIDGYMYVVDHMSVSGEKVPGTDGSTLYPAPRLVYKHYIGPTISSPIIVGNRIVAASYTGLYLFEHDEKLNFTLLDKMDGTFEASPIACFGRVFIASNSTGFLYCLGDK